MIGFKNKKAYPRMRLPIIYGLKKGHNTNKLITLFVFLFLSWYLLFQLIKDIKKPWLDNSFCYEVIIFLQISVIIVSFNAEHYYQFINLITRINSALIFLLESIAVWFKTQIQLRV
jgi:hypothetical protein